jgi:hypothetical protein
MGLDLDMIGIDEIGKKIPAYPAKKPKEAIGRTKESFVRNR